MLYNVHVGLHLCFCRVIFNPSKVLVAKVAKFKIFRGTDLLFRCCWSFYCHFLHVNPSDNNLTRFPLVCVAIAISPNFASDWPKLFSMSKSISQLPYLKNALNRIQSRQDIFILVLKVVGSAALASAYSFHALEERPPTITIYGNSQDFWRVGRYSH